MTAAGQIKVKKGVISKGRHTKDSEELRIKYTLINNAWLFARSRFTSRDWVQTLQRDSFQTLSAYILGPKVKGLESAEISGVKIQPEWSTVIMPYEKEIRKKMYKLTREGTSNGWCRQCVLQSVAKRRGRYTSQRHSRSRSQNTTGRLRQATLDHHGCAATAAPTAADHR